MSIQQGIYNVDHLIHTFSALLSITQEEASDHLDLTTPIPVLS
jgi:hypothetical protein